MNLDLAVKACSQVLSGGFFPEINDYLDSRLSKGLQETFEFGVFPTRENLAILFSFIEEMTLLDNNLIYIRNDYTNNREYFCSPMEEHNLVLPYKDVSGKPIALVGRSLLKDEERKELGVPKYKNTSFEKSKNLFGLYEGKSSIIEKNYVYIVEGQFDCIQAHSIGLKNIVALGSSSLSLEQITLLMRYTNNILLLLDNDAAGEEGRELAKSKYGKYCSIQDRKIPTGFKDLDEMILSNKQISSEELESALKSN